MERRLKSEKNMNTVTQTYKWWLNLTEDEQTHVCKVLNVNKNNMYQTMTFAKILATIAGYIERGEADQLVVSSTATAAQVDDDGHYQQNGHSTVMLDNHHNPTAPQTVSACMSDHSNIFETSDVQSD